MILLNSPEHTPDGPGLSFDHGRPRGGFAATQNSAAIRNPSHLSEADDADKWFADVASGLPQPLKNRLVFISAEQIEYDGSIEKKYQARSILRPRDPRLIVGTDSCGGSLRGAKACAQSKSP